VSEPGQEGGSAYRKVQGERFAPKAGGPRPGRGGRHPAPRLDGEAGEVSYVPRPKKVKRDDVIFFANQLAVMVDTGVPLSEALDAILQQTEHPGMQYVVGDLSHQVKSGLEFSSALERHPKVFGALFVSLMRASEASGTMGQMLKRVSDYMKEERDIRKQVKGAMIYPVCMLTFCVLVVTGILIFVLPRFEKIYAGKGAALPAPTRLLLAMSNALVGNWPVVLVALAAAVAGIIWYARTAGGKRFFDTLRISVPVVGPMYRKAYLARSMRTMATMVSSGVNMLDGLAITAQVAGNLAYRRIWLQVAEHVKEGATLSEHLRTSPIVPYTVSQMIAAGERTGKLSIVMDRVAEFCESDLKSAVKAVTSIIEPLMIIVMGLLIGGIAMALLLPVFNVSRIMAK
jgi:type IV pilus assembly protein PilC